MNDQDIIRKAVESADGWTFNEKRWKVYPPGFMWGLSLTKTVTLDALAAQLVRQVDRSLPKSHRYVQIFSDSTRVMCVRFARHKSDCVDTEIHGPDRTMNTLKAIVESGVLE